MKLKYWLWLTQIPYIGVVTANKLMDCMGDPQVVFEADENTLRQTGILNKRQLRNIVENHDMVLAETIINNCRTLGISIMTKQIHVIQTGQNISMMHRLFCIIRERQKEKNVR